MRLAGALALIAAASIACGEKKQIVLDAEGARVKLEASPFRLVVESPQRGAVLSSVPGGGDGAYGTPAATHDHYELKTQLIPGWDGYVPHEDPWLRAEKAKLEQIDATHATATLERKDAVIIHLEVSVEAAKVRLHMKAENPAGDAFDKSTLAFDLDPDGHFFGLGERYASVDHRGLSLYSWSEEGGLGLGENTPRGPMNPSPNGPSMTYFPVPFYLSNLGYGLLIDTTYRSEVHLGSEDPEHFRIAVNHDELGLVLYLNDDPRETLRAYTADTGRAQVPAMWNFGPRRRVSSGQQVGGVDEWKMLRIHGVPTTVLDDSVHFLPQRSELGRETELSNFTSTLHANGFKVVAYNNPYVSSSLPMGKADYDFGKAHRYFVLDTHGKPAETVLISGELQNVVSVDFTNPDAVTWYQSMLERTLNLGYDGWMHDFGEYIERDWILLGGRGSEFHNLYPVLSAKAAHDLLEAKRPGDYLFYVRAGYVGTQQYVPEVWGGDPEVSFDETQGLPAMLRGGINLGLTGVPFWGSDLSGFKCITDSLRDKELYLRWAQVGAMSTSMHDENACSNPLGHREKWTLWSDEETTRVYGDLARLHTRLAPYFMVLAKEAHDSGTPPMRHPFMMAPHDPDLWSVEDAFFLGPALYASPVVRRGVTVKDTTFPSLSRNERFVDLDDFMIYAGGTKAQVPAPLDKLPLMLVEGQILPLLDRSIETLATATATSVVTPDKVADRLDVMVALGTTAQASLTLYDGTVLTAERTAGANGMQPASEMLSETSSAAIAGCALCFVKTRPGQAERWQLNSKLAAESDLLLGDLHLHAQGPAARRIRWDVLRLP